MLFVYPTPQYPRRPLEYVFKALYAISNTLHIVALVVLIADFYTRLKVSMPEYYTNGSIVVADGIKAVLQDCTYTGEIHLGNVRGLADVSLGSIPYALMTMAQYVTGLFVLQFLLIVNNGICARNYTTGNRHLRLFGVHVPLYHVTVTFTYVYCIAIIALTWSFDTNRRFYERGLRYCEEQLRASNVAALYESEYSGGTIFSTAVYWPFGSVCLALLLYFAAAVVLCVHSHHSAVTLLSEADAPWESRGPFCMTSKPLLRLHTAQRNAIIRDAKEAIHRGESVRIVRSYQLMTEEDFNAVVQAMREQVAQMTKEQQFEKMREHFGDDASKLDHGGFTWRHDIPSAPPSPAAAEEFYDVGFDDYFTDNGPPAATRGGIRPTQLPLDVSAQEGNGEGEEEVDVRDDAMYGDGDSAAGPYRMSEQSPLDRPLQSASSSFMVDYEDGGGPRHRRPRHRVGHSSARFVVPEHGNSDLRHRPSRPAPDDQAARTGRGGGEGVAEVGASRSDRTPPRIRRRHHHRRHYYSISRRHSLNSARGDNGDVDSAALTGRQELGTPLVAGDELTLSEGAGRPLPTVAPVDQVPRFTSPAPDYNSNVNGNNTMPRYIDAARPVNRARRPRRTPRQGEIEEEDVPADELSDEFV